MQFKENPPPDSWIPIWHESQSDSCDIGFRVQFNAEFTSQAMDFPVEYHK